jgi:hypothetical protein
MTSFVLGVVSSIVASALLVVFSWFASAASRDKLIRLLSRLTGLGLARVYPTQQAANKDIHRDLARARWVKVFSGRGNELTRDSFAKTWEDGTLDSIEVLLPRPGTSWLERREAECVRYDPGFGNGLLAAQVSGNLRYLTARTDHGKKVNLKLYDFPQLCRIIATDRVVYLTPYTEREHGRNSPCYVFQRSSAMYDFALRIFASAWADATTASDSEEKPTS